jgi:hypothetical protein
MITSLLGDHCLMIYVAYCKKFESMRLGNYWKSSCQLSTVNFISCGSAAHFTQCAGLSGFSQFCQFPRVFMFRAQGFFCLAALPLLLVTSANRTAVILAHWLIAVVVTVHLRPSFDRRECRPIWAMECWWKFHSNSSLSSFKVTSLLFTKFPNLAN